MKIEKLTCPSCGAPLEGDFSPNQRVECTSCGVPLFLTHLDTDNPIFCPQCRTLNADTMRYCVNCGEKLKQPCPLCHVENRLDVTHCAKCGVHLDRARTKRSVMEQARQRIRTQRIEALKEKEARQKQERLERLLEALDEPENHEMAIYQINQMGVEAVEPLIETMLVDDDPDARYGSARALGQICAARKVKVLIKARTAKALVKALADSEPAVRYWAAEALSRCQSRTAIKPLARLLDDPHEGVREQAEASLLKIDEDQAQKILAQKHKRSSRGFLGWIKGD